MGERTVVEPEFQRMSEFNSAMIRFFAVAIRTAPVHGYQFAIRTGVHSFRRISMQ